MKIILFIVYGFLLSCNGMVMLNGKRDIKTDDTIMKASLMKCSKNETNSITKQRSQINIQLLVQMPGHTIRSSNNNGTIGKLFLGEVSDFSRKYECGIMSPNLIEVSNEESVLMYPMKFETLAPTTTQSLKNRKVVIDSENEDVHNANKLQLLDHIGLKISELKHKTSGSMHPNPKDLLGKTNPNKMDSKEDSENNNEKNEYATEEFDKTEREKNPFATRVNFNNNKIDNFENVELNQKDDGDIISDVAYFSKNLFNDKDSRKYRKNVEEQRNDFIECVGMKNFKKIDQLLCTCARNQDETEIDEESECFQLINNVCLWNPQYNQNTHKNDRRRSVMRGTVKSRSFLCCNLLPKFYLRIGMKCYQSVKEDYANDDEYEDLSEWPEFTKQRLPDRWPEIIKNESELNFGNELSFIHSRKTDNIKKHKVSDSQLKTPSKSKKHSVTNAEAIKHAHRTEEKSNNYKDERIKHFQSKSHYNKNVESKSDHRREATPFDKEIYDRNLNIADKLQLINMINPKRPCESNRMNPISIHKREQNVENSGKSSFYNNDENDEYSDEEGSDQLYNDYKELGETKDHSDAELGETKDYSDAELGETKDYSDAELGETKDYSDEELGGTKDYSVAELGETKDYSDASSEKNIETEKPSVREVQKIWALAVIEETE